MDADGSGNINIKELIDFLQTVSGDEVDKDLVKYVFIQSREKLDEMTNYDGIVENPTLNSKHQFIFLSRFLAFSTVQTTAETGSQNSKSSRKL